MRGIIVIAAVALLSTECRAQNSPTNDQCEQVRSAIAQYGLQAARKHAMENYNLSLADVIRIEQDCGIARRGGRGNR